MTTLNNCTFTDFYPETQIAIRNIDEYLLESFGIPEGQKLPADHFEFKGYLSCGDKRSGKTWLNDKYLAYKAWELWGNDIDFFKAEDIYALIDGVAESEKPVHFILLDDQVSKLDSRNPMGNKTITELYFEIAHELQKRSKAMGGNLGGLVICAILTQNYIAIDTRLRSDSMFTILKTYDESACRAFNLDEDVEMILRDWKIRSNRLTDYEARKWAFVIDIMNEGAIIYFDATLPKYTELPFEFTFVRGIDRYRVQRNKLVNYLVQNFNIIQLSDKELKEELYEKLDELENSLEKCRITSANFSEIIYRARKQFKKLHRHKIEKKQNAQKQELIEYLYTTFDMNEYQDAELKGELFYKLDELKNEFGEDKIFVNKKDFLEIIWRAKKKYRDKIGGKLSKDELNPNKKSLRERIIGLMTYEKRVFSIEELSERLKSSNKTVGTILSRDKDTFKSLEDIVHRRGVYCLVDVDPTDIELEPYFNGPIKLKKLTMESE